MKKNTGIDILKIILPLAVICDHYEGDGFVRQIQATIGIWAVPCFMFVSFYLIADKIKLGGKYICKRIKRLYFPVIIWSSLFFLINILVYQFDNNVWKHIIIQFITGSDSFIAPQMWFNITQIIVIAIVGTIILLTKRNKNIVLLIVFILVIVAEYLNIVISWTNAMTDAFKYPAGRVIEMLPFAIAGYWYGILSTSTKDKWNKVIIVVFALLTFIFWEIGNGTAVGLNYGGVKTLTTSIMICLIFINLPLKRDNAVITYLSGASAGIYYMHYTVGQLLFHLVIRSYFSEFHCNIWYAIEIYLLCVIILIPIRFALRKSKTYSYIL